MAILQSSALGLWFDLVPEQEEAFNEWHRTEHLAERVHIPGFLRGRRFVSVKSGSPKYLALYEQTSPDVLSSDRYISLLNNPNAMSQAMLPQVRNGFRTAYVVTAQQGDSDGIGIASVRFEADSEALQTVKDTLPAIAAVEGVASVTIGEAEQRATNIMTTERRIGGASTPTSTYLLLCEVTDPAVFDSDAYVALLGPDGSALAGLGPVVSGQYQLVQEYRRPADLPE